MATVSAPIELAPTFRHRKQELAKNRLSACPINPCRQGIHSFPTIWGGLPGSIRQRTFNEGIQVPNPLGDFIDLL